MLVFMVLSYGTFNALLHMVPNTKCTFLSLIIGKPHYSKSKQTLGFEKELVNKKVTSILYSHVFRYSLDWFSVRYVCIITSKTMITYYGSIYIELTVGFSFSFLLIMRFGFLLFFFGLHLCKWSGGFASKHQNEANFGLIPFCHDVLFGLLASRTY